MNYSDARDRYHNSPPFKALVDMMIAAAMSLEMSPGELREAAVFAEITVGVMKPVREFTEARERRKDALVGLAPEDPPAEPE